MSICAPRHYRSFCFSEGLASSLWREVMKPPLSFTQGRFCHQPPPCSPDASVHTQTHRQTNSTSSVMCTWPWLRQVNRTVEKGVKLTNDQDDSHAPSVHTCHVKHRHSLLIVQMDAKKAHVSQYSDIDSTYIPYPVVYPMLSSLCERLCVYSPTGSLSCKHITHPGI